MLHRKTKSNSTINSLTSRLQISQEDVNELARGTIIPFVMSKFTYRASGASERVKKVQKNPWRRNDFGKQLAVSVIANRMNKFVKEKYGKKLIMSFKINKFFQKIETMLQNKQQDFKKQALRLLKLKKDKNEVVRSLLVISFLYKKKQLLTLSSAFHKVYYKGILALKKQERQQKQESQTTLYQTERGYSQEQSLMVFSHKKPYRHKIQRLTESCFINSQTVPKSSPPSPFKRDTYQKPPSTPPFWKVNSQFFM